KFEKLENRDMFRISEMVSGFGESLGFGSSFDSYIPKPETFRNASGGFDTHV
ncbi:9889_t:CDS:1, partial [Rhizophagus irregularis]